MRYVVTGASGFVGARLVATLEARGEFVVGTKFGNESDTADLLTADVRDPAQVTEVVAAAKPDVIVHLAGTSHVGASWRDPARYFQVNVLGTEHVLAAANGARVVLASSAEVYGDVPEEEQPIVEDRPVAPQSPYALTKAAAERLALGAGAIVVRSVNAVGPRQAPKFALPAFAAQLAATHRGESEPVLRVGNLAARRDFVHLDDVIDGYLTVAELGQPGEMYNLGTGKARSIDEMAQRLIAVTGLKVDIKVDPERFRPVDLPLLSVDASRLRSLGWQPRRTLDDALLGLWEATLAG